MQEMLPYVRQKRSTNLEVAYELGPAGFKLGLATRHHTALLRGRISSGQHTSFQSLNSYLGFYIASP